MASVSIKKLRKNLRELADMNERDSKHAATRFWRWLRKQPWRKMLPEPKAFLDSNKKRRDLKTYGVPYFRPVLRLEVVMLDRSRLDPYYLENWHVFLPSELFLGPKKY